MITVIIPSLVKKNLNRLLIKLCQETLISKIILSIPYHANKKNYNYKNKKIKVFKNAIKHQVQQRINSQNYVASKFVLYLDDDVLFDRNFIKNLYRFKFQRGTNSVVGPVYYDLQFHKIHKLNGNIIFQIKKIIHFLLFLSPIGRSRMGKVTSAGLCYGVDPDFIGTYLKTEWIPGGCILINKKDMIRKNYFPSKGKAFCEDLIMSYIFIKKKLNIFIYKKCKVINDTPQKLNSKRDINFYLKGLKNYFLIKKSKSYFYYILVLYYKIKLFFK